MPSPLLPVIIIECPHNTSPFGGNRTEKLPEAVQAFGSFVLYNKSYPFSLLYNEILSEYITVLIHTLYFTTVARDDKLFHRTFQTLFIICICLQL